MQPLNVDKIDMDYLKSDEIGKVLAKGLAVVYKVQPTFPVDFFAKWLINYSITQTNQEHLDNQIQNKEQLKVKQIEQRGQSDAEALTKKKQQDALLKEEAEFKQHIQNHLFHQKLLCGEFCDFLVSRHPEVCGVYVGYVDHPTKQITENDDEELAHIDSSLPKLINYIGACNSHVPIMIGKNLALDAGVTGDVFKEPAPVEVQELAEGDLPEPIKLVTVYVASVVQEPRMVYFQWPKLGSFFAVPLTYNSCLFDQALDRGIEERIQFRRSYAEQMKERDMKDQEFQERIRSAQASGEEYEYIVEEQSTFKAEWQDVLEPEFIYQKREFVLCIDSLGKDREIPPETRQYYQDYAVLFALKWEERERILLSRDIDHMILYQEQVNIQERSESLTLAEEQAVDASSHKYEDLRDRDKEYNFELQSVRLHKLTSQLNELGLFTDFLQLKEMRVFKFPGILQALLLFLGYDKSEILLKGTNLLDWEGVKPLVNDSLFAKIGEYTHRGAKSEPIREYAKLNRIGRRLDRYQLEEVEAYNVCYGKMLKWLQLTLSLRKTDIEIRRTKIDERRALREQRIMEVERMKEDKSVAIDNHKATLTTDELETFIQEEWEITYDQDHQLPEIPNEVDYDIDEDWDE